MADMLDHSTGNAKASPNARPNTLGIDAKTVFALATRLDADSDSRAASKRDFVRWPFRRASIDVHVIQPGGTHTQLRLACRNLSRGGMSLLHSAYVHTGTRVVVTLPHAKLRAVDVAGAVVRCTHRGGVVHEVGIKFDHPIDARQFVSLDPTQEAFSLERVDPSRLTGALVVISESQTDQRLLQHFLRETQVRIRQARDLEQGKAFAQDASDLIICDSHLTGATGLDFINQLRTAGVQTPIIFMTADTSPQARGRATQVPGVVLLAKPLNQDRVLRAVAEFLSSEAQSPGSGYLCTLSKDDPSHMLVESYVRELRTYAGKLAEAFRGNDAETCERLCMQIKGSAPTMGFNLLGELAEKAARMVTWHKSVQEAQRSVKELIAACERARSA